MSEIKNIENLFVAGISLIKSTLEQEKLKSNDRYFWISKEVSNSIKKVLIKVWGRV